MIKKILILLIMSQSKEKQYIFKLENVIKQNEVLQEFIKELRNENILLNKQIDVI